MSARSGYWDLSIKHDSVSGLQIPGIVSYNENVIDVNVKNTATEYQTNIYTEVSEDIDKDYVNSNFITTYYNGKNYIVNSVSVITNAAENPVVAVTVSITLKQANDYTWSIIIRHSEVGKNFTINGFASLWLFPPTGINFSQVITSNNQTFSLGCTSENSIKNYITWTPFQIIEGIYTYNFTFSVTEELFEFTYKNINVELNFTQYTTGYWHLNEAIFSPQSDAYSGTFTLSNGTKNYTFTKYLSTSNFDTEFYSTYNDSNVNESNDEITFFNSLTLSPSSIKNGDTITNYIVHFSKNITYERDVMLILTQLNTGYYDYEAYLTGYPNEWRDVATSKYETPTFMYDNTYLKFEYRYGDQITTDHQYGSTLWYSDLGEDIKNDIFLYYANSFHSLPYETGRNSFSCVTKEHSEYKYSIVNNYKVQTNPWVLVSYRHEYTLNVEISQVYQNNVVKYRITSLVLNTTDNVTDDWIIKPHVMIQHDGSNGLESAGYDLDINNSNQATSGLTSGSNLFMGNGENPGEDIQVQFTHGQLAEWVVHDGERHLYVVPQVDITYNYLTVLGATITLVLTQEAGGNWNATIKHNLSMSKTLTVTFTYDDTDFTVTVYSTSHSISTGWTTAEGTPIYLSNISYTEYVEGSDNSIYKISLNYEYNTYGESKRIVINTISIEYTGTEDDPIPASGGTAYPSSVYVSYTKWMDYSNGNPSLSFGTWTGYLDYGTDFSVYWDSDRIISVPSKVDAIDASNSPTLYVQNGPNRTDYTRILFNVNWDGDIIPVTSSNTNFYVYQEANHCNVTYEQFSSIEKVIVSAYSNYNTSNNSIDAYISPSSGSFAANGSPGSIEVQAFEHYETRVTQRQSYRNNTITNTTYTYTYTSTYQYTTSNQAITSTGSLLYEYSYGPWEDQGWINDTVHLSVSGANNTAMSFMSDSDVASVTASSLGTNYYPSSQTLKLEFPRYSGGKIYANFTQAANTATVSYYQDSSSSKFEYRNLVVSLSEGDDDSLSPNGGNISIYAEASYQYRVVNEIEIYKKYTYSSGSSTSEYAYTQTSSSGAWTNKTVNITSSITSSGNTSHMIWMGGTNSGTLSWANVSTLYDIDEYINLSISFSIGTESDSDMSMFNLTYDGPSNVWTYRHSLVVESSVSTIPASGGRSELTVKYYTFSYLNSVLQSSDYDVLYAYMPTITTSGSYGNMMLDGLTVTAQDSLTISRSNTYTMTINVSYNGYSDSVSVKQAPNTATISNTEEEESSFISYFRNVSYMYSYSVYGNNGLASGNNYILSTSGEIIDDVLSISITYQFSATAYYTVKQYPIYTYSSGHSVTSTSSTTVWRYYSTTFGIEDTTKLDIDLTIYNSDIKTEGLIRERGWQYLYNSSPKCVKLWNQSNPYKNSIDERIYTDNTIGVVWYHNQEVGRVNFGGGTGVHSGAIVLRTPS